MITIYSLFWSIINCCLMAFIIFLLRTRTTLISRYGTAVLSFLTVCCVIRILLPVEFPKHQYILADNFIYSWIVKHFKFILLPEFRQTVLIVFIIIWILGSLFSIFRLMRKAAKVQKVIRANACIDNLAAAKVLASIDADCKLPVRICSGISVPVLAGVFHPAIYFPDYPYTEQQLRYVLLHEYTHWKRKDIWKKLAMNVICVLVWWNPAVYIIRKELTQLIEFHCDRTLVRDLSSEEIVDYLSLLMLSFKRAQNPLIKTNLYTIEFVNTSKQYTIMQRFDLLLHRREATRCRRLIPALLVVLGLVWMSCSYYFILQTNYYASETSIHNEDILRQPVIKYSNNDNAYIEEQGDGTYIFYYNGEEINISSSDVENGLYDYYPIIKYKDNANIFIKFFIKIKDKIINLFL